MAAARLATLFLFIATSAFAHPAVTRPDLRTQSGRALGWDGRRLPGAAVPAAAAVAGTNTRIGASGALDGTWSELGPPVRIGPRVVLDTAHDRLLAFGGGSGADGFGFRYVNDVWTLDLASPAEWKRLEVAGPRPEPRSGHGVTYDALRHRLVVFGGFRVLVHDGGYEFRYLSDTWALELEGTPRWDRLAADGPQPEGRSGAPLVYDGARDRILAVGGYNSGIGEDGVYYDETWSLDLGRPAATWTLLPKVPNGPIPRAFGLAAKDEATDRLVLFGGQSSSTLDFADAYHRDVWTLALAPDGAWDSIEVAGTQPPLRWAEASTWDPVRRRIAIYGGASIDESEAFGLLSDLWSFDLDGARWTEGEPSGARPLPRQSASLTGDESGDRLHLFGGEIEGLTGMSDTWSWSDGGSAWLEQRPHAPTPRRFGAAAAFDEAARSLVVFGGGWTDFSFDPQTPTFAYDNLEAWLVDEGRWSRLEAQGTGPEARWDAASAFDATHRRLWIIGGASAEGPNFDDTWALELEGGPRWRTVPNGGPHPSGRQGASAIYDVQEDRVILYGGTRDAGEGEVWQLRNHAWSQLAVEGSIPARTGAMAVYDSRRHRMIVLGGAWYDKFDAWALSLDATPAWTRIEAGGTSPRPGAGGRAVYDAQADRVLVFGGIESGNFFATDSNVYELALGDSPAWRRLAPAGDAALARSDHVAAFDAARGRLLITGGWDGITGQSGSFELAFGSSTLTVALDVRPGSPSDALPAHSRGPLPVALLSAPGFDPAQVDVASLRLEGAPASVPARPAKDWNGDGTTDLLVEFDPAQMQPHGDRLALTGALLDGTPIEGTAFVSGKANQKPKEVGKAFAIRALGTSGTMRFAASLAQAGAWKLDLFDVRGRRVASADGVADEAGETLLELPGSPASGVYFVRLRSGAESTRTRIAWTRP